MEQTTKGNGGLSISWLLQIKAGCCDSYNQTQGRFYSKQEVKPDELVSHAPFSP